MQTTTLKKEKRTGSKNGGDKNGKKTSSSNGKRKLTPAEMEQEKFMEKFIAEFRRETGIMTDYSTFTEEELEAEAVRLFDLVHEGLAGTENPFV